MRSPALAIREHWTDQELPMTRVSAATVVTFVALQLAGARAVVGAQAHKATPGMGGMHAAAGMVMYHAPQWSPDGQWLLVSANRERDMEIYLIRADGGAIRQLTHNESDDMARWSDDGTRILVETTHAGGSKWVSMKADASDVRPFTPDSVVSRSPDGTTLLFESVRDGRGRLFLMSSARTNVRQVATARHAEQGSFSPDGKSIVFEQRSTMHDDVPHSQIVVSRPDGSEPKVVAVGTDPSWSKDGSLILFKAPDDKTNKLWISTVAPNGAGERRLAVGVHMQYSPDGRRIAFMRDTADGNAHVWIMNADGTGQECISCRIPKNS
jgi:Tol biopolymer transport system component